MHGDVEARAYERRWLILAVLCFSLLIIVLDNSMSSGRVLGERRVLDDLKALARETLAGASDEDRFWVIRAGEPWLPAIAGGLPEARAAVDGTEVSDAAGDLTAALRRAAELLQTSELEDREIHLLSDMQRTAFTLPGEDPARGIPVVVWVPDENAPANRALQPARFAMSVQTCPQERAPRDMLFRPRQCSSVDTTRAPGPTWSTSPFPGTPASVKHSSRIPSSASARSREPASAKVVGPAPLMLQASAPASQQAALASR